MAAQMIGNMSGVTSTPLISFHAIIDEDLACLKYAVLCDKDNDVFNIFDRDKIKNKTWLDIVYDIYMRDYKNPLRYISKDHMDDYIDDLYNHLINNKEKEVLKHYIITEIGDLIQEFVKSSEVIPYIMYYTEAQKEFLSSIQEFSKISTVSFVEAKNNINKWSQFYFKSIDEMQPFENVKNKTYYFASCRLNLSEDAQDIGIPNDKVLSMIRNGNKFNLYDLYRMNIIRRE